VQYSRLWVALLPGSDVLLLLQAMDTVGQVSQALSTAGQLRLMQWVCGYQQTLRGLGVQEVRVHLSWSVASCVAISAQWTCHWLPNRAKLLCGHLNGDLCNFRSAPRGAGGEKGGYCGTHETMNDELHMVCSHFAPA
jgi:hypothetical protein